MPQEDPECKLMQAGSTYAGEHLKELLCRLLPEGSGLATLQEKEWG